jgi:sugar phosphate isomerase/epimerase
VLPIAPAPSYTVILTMLNGMAGNHPEAAMDRHRALGLRLLDLKDAWFGKRVEQWTTEEADRVAAAAATRRLRVATVSTSIGGGTLERGEAVYRAELEGVGHVAALAAILGPTRIRLVAPSLAARGETADAVDTLRHRHPWIFPALREAVDRLQATGADVVFENESVGSVFGHPDEVLGFFRELDRPRTRMIWDVGNWWHFGCRRFPTVEDARALLPAIGMLHLKGGMPDAPQGELRWQAQLSATPWDVTGIVGCVLAAGASPIVCLNPPHGAARPGVVYDYRADLEYLRAAFPEIEP